jgi:hypothetical protein
MQQNREKGLLERGLVAPYATELTQNRQKKDYMDLSVA